MNNNRIASRQRGAALIIGLVLLLVMSVLAVSTMSSATFGLTMAGNAQYTENAFQLAETGIEVAINDGPFSTDVANATPLTAVTDLDGNPIGEFEATTDYIECTPIEGFSEDSFKAFNFQITSTGTSARSAASLHQQDFFLVGPNACQ